MKPELLLVRAICEPTFLDSKRDLAAMIEGAKATLRRPGVAEIRLPGERAMRERECCLREGVEIDQAIYDAPVALKA